MKLKRLNRGRLATPQLFSKRLMLRPLLVSDFAQWSEVRILNRDWLEKWEPTRSSGYADTANDKEAYRSRCQAWEQEAQFGRAQQFGIFLPYSGDGSNGEHSKNPNDLFIGEINVSAILKGISQSCSLGYWIDQRHAGNSYVAEATIAVAKFAFEELGLHRVQIAIIPRNDPSLKVVEKLELRKEGLAERYLEINGTWEDHHIFAITAEEYESRKSELHACWLEE